MNSAIRALHYAGAIAASLVLISCINPFDSESGASSGGLDRATATIYLGSLSGQSVVPGIETLISEYVVTLSRSGQEDRTGSGVGTISIADVAVGLWNVTVEARDNADRVVGVGAGTVDVGEEGGSTTISVSPTTGGSGSLDITVEWNPGSAVDSVADANLAPVGGGSEIDVTGDFATAASSATYTNSAVTSGQYLLTVKLAKSGSHVATVMEVIYIYDNVETSGTVSLGSSEIAQAPASPIFVTATTSGTSGSDTIDLSWTDPSTVETGFEIERRVDGVSAWTSVTTTAANATGHSDTGLAAGTTYEYRVRAVNDFGESEWTVLNINAKATTDLSGVLHVSTTGNDATATGSQSAPYATISAAISAASGGYQIRVASGEYDEVVYLQEGVNLYGGYEASGWTRNIEANETTIVNSGTADSWTLYSDATATVDGFTIRTYPESGSPVSGVQFAAIFFGGSPSISNSRLIGGSNGGESRTVHMQGSSSPTIQDSYINTSATSSSDGAIGISFASGFSGTLTVENSEVEISPITSAKSYGLRAYGSSSGTIAISNSTFHSSSSFTSAYDVEAIRSYGFNEVRLESVTVDLHHGGSSQAAYAVAGEFTDLTVRNSSIRVEADRPWLFLVQGNGSQVLVAENNSLYGLKTASTGGGYGVYLLGDNLNATVRNNLVAVEEGAGDATTFAISTPSVNSADVSNNVFYNAGDSVEAAHHNDADGNLTFTSVAGLGLADPDGTNPNVADLSLTSSTAPSITQGGLDLSGSFAVDITGASRTTPWSIGAYEFDGAPDSGGAEVTITFSNPNDPDVSFSGAADGDSVSQGTSLTLTAPTGYNEYTWYLDGTEAPTTGIATSGNSATVTTGDLFLGTHSIALVVSDGVNLYSAQVDFTVVQ